MRARKIAGALAVVACAWLSSGTARAVEPIARPELSMLTPDDNLGLLALLCGLLAFWCYFRGATDEPR